MSIYTEETPLMRLAKLNIRLRGFTPSAACWEDDRSLYACSAESAPGTNGHPRHEIQLNKRAGKQAANGYYITARRTSGEVMYATDRGMCPNAGSIALRYETRLEGMGTMVRRMTEYAGLRDWQIEAIPAGC